MQERRDSRWPIEARGVGRCGSWIEEEEGRRPDLALVVVFLAVTVQSRGHAAAAVRRALQCRCQWRAREVARTANQAQGQQAPLITWKFGRRPRSPRRQAPFLDRSYRV